MDIILEVLGGKLYQRQQPGIQLQLSVIPRQEGRYEGGAGLGLWHCVILRPLLLGTWRGEQDAHVSCHGHVCVLSGAKEWGHSTGMSNTLSEGAEVAGFILIWKCGPCCLLWCASLSCLWQLWEYWFWQTAAKSSRLEGVSNKCDKRGKLLMPGGKAQGPADYQNPSGAVRKRRSPMTQGWVNRWWPALSPWIPIELPHSTCKMSHWLEGKDAPKEKGRTHE